MFTPADSTRAEMFGLPGAGKSWLCSALRGCLAGSFLSSADAEAAACAGALARLRADERIAAFLQAAIQMLDRGDADPLLRRRRQTWVRREMEVVLAAEAAPGPVICDEGLVQRGASVASSHGDGAEIAERYFHTVPPPRAVVLVDAPRELTVARLRARGAHQAYHIEQIGRNAAHIGAGARILRRRGTTVIVADGLRLVAQGEAELARVAGELRQAFSPGPETMKDASADAEAPRAETQKGG